MSSGPKLGNGGPSAVKCEGHAGVTFKRQVDGILTPLRRHQDLTLGFARAALLGGQHKRSFDLGSVIARTNIGGTNRIEMFGYQVRRCELVVSRRLNKRNRSAQK